MALEKSSEMSSKIYFGLLFAISFRFPLNSSLENTLAITLGISKAHFDTVSSNPTVIHWGILSAFYWQLIW